MGHRDCASKTTHGVDLNAVREKYRLERDKRLRPEGADQYIAVSGRWAAYGESDPYAETIIEREPISDEVNVVIVGGGFSGLVAGVRMAEAGVEDFHIIEAASDFGGTWYFNRYPGVQCDIESYCYIPLLEELNYMPKEKYSYGSEIYEHCQRIGRHYGLYERAWFQTRVRSVDWDDDTARWRISTNRGDDIKARFVVVGLGNMNRPKLPGVPGIDEFEGHSFHTSRWDYAYTGGGPEGGLTGLADKRVAILGTGATAVQVVPHLGRDAKHLYVFQRTPSSVDLRGNKPTDPEWWKSLKPGWQRARRNNLGEVFTGRPVAEDMVADGWTDTYQRLRRMMFAADSELTLEEKVELAEIADFEKMEEIRKRVADTVTDPEVAEALKPYYRQFCKRPTFNDDYLPTFNRENVTLVDVSDTKGIERITKKGIFTGGKEFEVDCIIFASGFEVNRFDQRIGFAINGRDGLSLFDHWSSGVKTLHGLTTRGFPNFFLMGPSQSAQSPNFGAMADVHAEQVAYVIAETQRRGGVTVETTQEAQDAWVAEFTRVRAGFGGVGLADAEFQESCTPGYRNNEGRTAPTPADATYIDPLNDPAVDPETGRPHLAGLPYFEKLLQDWRAQGSMAGYEIDGRDPRVRDRG